MKETVFWSAVLLVVFYFLVLVSKTNDLACSWGRPSDETDGAWQEVTQISRRAQRLIVNSSALSSTLAEALKQ